MPRKQRPRLFLPKKGLIEKVDKKVDEVYEVDKSVVDALGTGSWKNKQATSLRT